MTEDHPSWWRGSRGEWYVAGQLALMALVFLGPRHLPGGSPWTIPSRPVSVTLGVTLLVFGAALMLAGLFRLGANLTPLPHPKDHATLVEAGAYRLVRHPIYSGGMALALGWAFFVQGGLTLAYVALLVVFLDVKSRREERWLVATFPDYAGYQRRVRRFVPFVY